MQLSSDFPGNAVSPATSAPNRLGVVDAPDTRQGHHGGRIPARRSSSDGVVDAEGSASSSRLSVPPPAASPQLHPSLPQEVPVEDAAVMARQSMRLVNALATQLRSSLDVVSSAQQVLSQCRAQSLLLRDAATFEDEATSRLILQMNHLRRECADLKRGIRRQKLLSAAGKVREIFADLERQVALRKQLHQEEVGYEALFSRRFCLEQELRLLDPKWDKHVRATLREHQRKNPNSGHKPMERHNAQHHMVLGSGNALGASGHRSPRGRLGDTTRSLGGTSSAVLDDDEAAGSPSSLSGLDMTGFPSRRAMGLSTPRSAVSFRSSENAAESDDNEPAEGQTGEPALDGGSLVDRPSALAQRGVLDALLAGGRGPNDAAATSHTRQQQRKTEHVRTKHHQPMDPTSQIPRQLQQLQQQQQQQHLHRKRHTEDTASDGAREEGEEGNDDDDDADDGTSTIDRRNEASRRDSTTRNNNKPLSALGTAGIFIGPEEVMKPSGGGGGAVSRVERYLSDRRSHHQEVPPSAHHHLRQLRQFLEESSAASNSAEPQRVTLPSLGKRPSALPVPHHLLKDDGGSAVGTPKAQRGATGVSSSLPPISRTPGPVSSALFSTTPSRPR